MVGGRVGSHSQGRERAPDGTSSRNQGLFCLGTFSHPMQIMALGNGM